MDKEMQNSWQVSQAEILSSEKVRKQVKSSIWNSKKIFQLPDVSPNQWVTLPLKNLKICLQLHTLHGESDCKDSLKAT